MRRPFLLNGRRVSSAIKSIQTVSITTSTVSATATIGAVDPNNTILIWNGFTTNQIGTSEPSAFCYISLQDSTTVKVQKIGGTDSITIPITVIEFWPGVIKSVQRGTISWTGSISATATIAAVDVTKSTVMFCGWGDNGNDNFYRVLPKLTLTNGVTVTAAVDTAPLVGITVAYQVVEWL
jgi:hypothetical protein